jgi:hypothetical protein
MKPTLSTTIALITAFAFGGFVSTYVMLVGNPAVDTRGSENSVLHPVWTEVTWPFLLDQWGKGKAFECKEADCGGNVYLYLRAKVGFCNCTTGIEDDAELDRLSDFELVNSDLLPLGAGRQIGIGLMQGRSRTYKLTSPNRPGNSAISVAFNEGCDALVATIVLPHIRPEIIEPSVINFLNSDAVLSWAKTGRSL